MLNKLLNYRKRAQLTIQTCLSNSEYLEPGEYFVDYNLRYLYRNDLATIKFMEETILKNNFNLNPKEVFNHKIKKTLVPTKIKISNQSTNKKVNGNFKGTVYLLSNDNTEEKDVKIFNIKDKQVLSVYVKLDDLKKKIQNYEYFGNYFKIPKINSYDFIKKTTIEELIDSKPKNDWNDFDYTQVIDTIFNSYAEYYKKYAQNNIIKTKPLGEITTRLYEDKVLSDLSTKIVNKISENMKVKELPQMYQHGDLWLYNTMLSKNSKEVYFIDWEHSEDYFLFYDLFWWIQNEAIYNNNLSYLENYVSGQYDSYFECICCLKDYSFNYQNRKDYLYIFLLELLDRRVLNSDEKTKEVAKDMYSKFFDQIQQVNG